jgi:hypothetical protein
VWPESVYQYDLSGNVGNTCDVLEKTMQHEIVVAASESNFPAAEELNHG